MTGLGLMIGGGGVLLLAARMPIGFILLLLGFVGVLVVRGADAAITLMGHRTFSVNRSYELSVVPLFVLMGHLTFAAGIGSELFATARAWLGHLRGGLVMATVMANAAFGACCGSTTAATGVFAKVAVPEMLRTGVNPRLAYGTVAVAGTLSALIPPSVLMVIYGILAQQSIAELLIAGILPGMLTAAMYCVMIWTRVRIDPSLAPLVARATLEERLRSTRGVWLTSALFLLVIGGIGTGWFTPSEAGAVGASGAFLIVLLKRSLTPTVLRQSFLETARTTAVIFICVTGALIFTVFLAFAGIAAKIATFVAGLPVAPIVIVIGTLILAIAMGCIVDPLSWMMLILPIVLPFLKPLGVDLIWYGLLVVKCAEIGQLTPPFGLNVFMVSSVLPAARSSEIFRGVAWYLAAEIPTMGLLIAFPKISLWLPQLMFY